MDSSVLRGTTLRVYRYLYRQGRPLGLHEIQRGVALSSASVALYHVRKLLEAGLVREQPSEGYVVDRMIFENIIRIRRSLIPFQSMYSAFLATSLIVLLTVMRPNGLSSSYIFSLMVISASLAIFLFQTATFLRRSHI